jgi:RNA polymerase sigma-70 factor (ECF subfamily)
MRVVASQESCVSIPDQQLISAASGGSRSDFEELYRRHVGTVFAFLRRCTGEETEAEDLTQEVFVRAWKRLDQFQSRSGLATWLISIAISVFRSSRRSGLRREKRQIEWHRYAVAVSGGGALSAEDAIDLELAIATLPARARMVLILHEINGYRHAEVASLMGITEGASKSHLSRARRILRRRLDR